MAGEYANHDDLRALLTHLDVPCATLVGHSLGARNAVDTAMAHPESVSALVLASPGVSGRPFADPYVAHHTAQQMAAMADPDSRALRERIHASASAHVMRHARGHRPNRSRRQAPTFRVGSPHGQPRVHDPSTSRSDPSSGPRLAPEYVHLHLHRSGPGHASSRRTPAMNGMPDIPVRVILPTRNGCRVGGVHESQARSGRRCRCP
ncbi:alpha/beta fold hydrolase [Streptomyces erythrochromogenes]|uniref:alpha/beta fold hydrolase n=1 Tax=Streptomyces erythrochromogenes TaxID=285574 RepID=UPI0036948278